MTVRIKNITFDESCTGRSDTECAPLVEQLGRASGAERLQIRLYDLLAHGWDLAQATEQPADLPDDLAEQSLAFARTQLTGQARPGRFGPAQVAPEQAPAIERLAAFLGRPVSTGGWADD